MHSIVGSEMCINDSMFSPGNANDWLIQRGSDLADLLVDDASKANLIEVGAEGDGQFAFAPNPKSIADGAGKISEALSVRDHICLLYKFDAVVTPFCAPFVLLLLRFISIFLFTVGHIRRQKLWFGLSIHRVLLPQDSQAVAGPVRVWN